MKFATLANSAEKIYLVAKNVTGNTITTGMATALAIGGNSFDGLSAVTTASGTAANLPGWIGIASKDIAVNDLGLIQSFGYAASILISNVGSSLTITQGDLLIPGAAAGALFSGAPTAANAGLNYVINANTTTISSGSLYVSGLIRCL